jgi:hypothetical protein
MSGKAVMRYLVLDAAGCSYVRQGGDIVRVDFEKELRRVMEGGDV